MNKVIKVLFFVFLEAATLEILLQLTVPLWGPKAGILDIKTFLATPANIEKVTRDFNKDLGWVTVTDVGELGQRKDIKYSHPVMATFGGSFVYCDEVAENQTWPAQLAQLENGDIYNFGVPAYGPDQSLLRYQMLKTKFHTPFVAMGISRENINRTVNVYRKFYFPETGMPATKPRFLLHQGDLEILPNPIQSREEIKNLKIVEFVKSLGEHDLWYQARLKQSFQPHFPLLFEFMTFHFWKRVFRLKEASEGDSGVSLDLWNNTNAVKLMRAIVKKFTVEVAKQKEIPVLILLPEKQDYKLAVKNRRQLWLENLLPLCQSPTVKCFNGEKALRANAAQFKSMDIDRYWAEHGHLSPLGNKIIAEGLKRKLDAWRGSSTNTE